MFIYNESREDKIGFHIFEVSGLMKLHFVSLNVKVCAEIPLRYGCLDQR